MEKQAWLFSTTALAEVKYRVLENGLAVAIAFAADGEDPWKRPLETAFGQERLWPDKTFFELHF